MAPNVQKKSLAVTLRMTKAAAAAAAAAPFIFKRHFQKLAVTAALHAGLTTKCYEIRVRE